MYLIYNIVPDLLAAAVFILPIWAIYHVLWFHNVKRTVVYLAFGFYFDAVLALTGFPSITSFHVELSAELIPFHGLASDYCNAGLNVLLFVPYGFFLPVLWNQFRSFKSVARMGLATT